MAAPIRHILVAELWIALGYTAPPIMDRPVFPAPLAWWRRYG
jgi:hypothetical protein